MLYCRTPQLRCLKLIGINSHVKQQQQYLFIFGAFVPLCVLLLFVFRPKTPAGPSRYWGVRFLSNGTTIATCGGSSNPREFPRRGEIMLWDVATETPKLTLRQSASVRSLDGSVDGNLIAFGDFSGNLQLLDVSSGRVTASIKSGKPINGVAFSRSGNLVVSGDLAGRITLWNLPKGTVETIPIVNEKVLNIALSDDDRAMVATTRTGRAYLFDLLQPQASPLMIQCQNATNNEVNVEAVAFSPKTTEFATGGNKQLRLWESPSGRLLREFSVASGTINSVAFSPTERRLAAVNSDGMLILYDIDSGEIRFSTQAHSGTSFSAAFSQDGKKIATVGRDDFMVKIWNSQTLSLLQVLQRVDEP